MFSYACSFLALGRVNRTTLNTHMQWFVEAVRGLPTLSTSTSYKQRYSMVRANVCCIRSARHFWRSVYGIVRLLSLNHSLVCVKSHVPSDWRCLFIFTFLCTVSVLCHYCDLAPNTSSLRLTVLVSLSRDTVQLGRRPSITLHTQSGTGGCMLCWRLPLFLLCSVWGHRLWGDTTHT